MRSERDTTDESSSDDGLRLRALAHPDGPSFALEHPYFEIVFSPLVGPTSVLLARALARHLHEAGGPTTVSAVELATEVGVRSRDDEALGKRSHLVRAIERLAHSRIVERLDDRVLGVRLAVAPVSDATLSRLPQAARDAHRRYLRDP